MLDTDAASRDLLTTTKTWAVVGCSTDPSRASHGVAAFLIAQGFTVVPVHPAYDEVLGQKCYPDLASVPVPIDVVDIFRRSDEAGVHVDEAIEVGARAVWLQLGVIDDAAAQRATYAGLRVVMDRCPRIDYPRLVGAAR